MGGGSVSNSRCKDCDRLDGWTNPPHDSDGAGCECEKCCARCWGGPQCASGSVDWRDRALAAEWRLAAAREALAGTHLSGWGKEALLAALGGPKEDAAEHHANPLKNETAYVEASLEAEERIAAGWTQRRCPTCDRWAVWVPPPAGEA